MPVVHIRALAPAGGTAQIDRTLSRVADSVAEVLGTDPAGTWCTFSPVERMTLGTRVVADRGQIAYVDVWIRPRDEATDAEVLAAACGAVGIELGLPVQDVWGTLRSAEPGRIFAGGAIMREDG